MLRTFALKIEPYLFRALQPLLDGRRTRSGRSLAVQKYLRGDGVEIGAFSQPNLIPVGATVKYVDRVPAAYWSEILEYKDVKIVDPDILDDGISLSTIGTDRFGFLIAAHMLEHTDDPIAALKNWLRVVKPGGHILLIVPDKRFTFDKNRLITPLDHFFRDHEEGPATSAADHYRDIATNTLGLTDAVQIDEYVAKNEPAVHFHTWTFDSFLEFLMATNKYLGSPFEIVEAQLNVGEDLAVLKVL